ncbi:hypothetical protein QVD17_20226 [Tagetes erecta]|uniref:Replication factor A C-terminal domain-containing protein n=1 Tax=Tagetes erecta TaxID=13708 RepID=A0AAD8KSG1_TARER|nr:hypothetical protein QVD17_20226 [Tagetes erecta]
MSWAGPEDIYLSTSLASYLDSLNMVGTVYGVKYFKEANFKSTKMEHTNITLIKNIDLTNDDITMKLRIVRLWKLPDHINKKEVYSIEMILMDEEGTKISGTVSKKFLFKFSRLLNENIIIFLIKPNFGKVRSSYKYVDNTNKVVFVSSTQVERCNVFNGPQFGFSFTSLKAILEHQVLEDLSVDVIGEVQDLQPIKTFLNGEGIATKQATFKIQDLEGQVISVTLFAEYAEQLIDYLQKHPEEVRLVVILQFGRIKWWQEKPAVNTSYHVTKLFINDDIEEIITFKKSITTTTDNCGSLSTTMSKGSFISIVTDDELFLKTEFINIEEVSEIKEEKHVVILATIIGFIEDKPWGYFGCTKCYKKVEPLILIDDKPKSPAEVEEPTIYRCTKCLIDVTIPIPRFRIEIRVQDHTGVVSLTLFDREARKLLKVSAKDLIGSQSKQVIQSNQEVSDFYAYPPLLTTLLERKFAFKIEISKFVLDHSLSVYGINKITADDSIISQLNQKVDLEQPDESDSQRLTYMFVASQDTPTMKDVVSVTDDNVTPASHAEKSTATSPLVRGKNSAVSSTSSDLKRNLSDAYGVDPPTANSTTKKDRSSVSSGQADQVKLLVPKVEK